MANLAATVSDDTSPWAVQWKVQGGSPEGTHAPCPGAMSDSEAPGSSHHDCNGIALHSITRNSIHQSIRRTLHGNLTKLVTRSRVCRRHRPFPVF